MINLTHKEKKALLDSVADKPQKEQVLTVFLKGVEFALTGTLPATKKAKLFQPKQTKGV